MTILHRTGTNNPKIHMEPHINNLIFSYMEYEKDNVYRCTAGSLCCIAEADRTKNHPPNLYGTIKDPELPKPILSGKKSSRRHNSPRLQTRL